MSGELPDNDPSCEKCGSYTVSVHPFKGVWYIICEKCGHEEKTKYKADWRSKQKSRMNGKEQRDDQTEILL